MSLESFESLDSLESLGSEKSGGFSSLKGTKIIAQGKAAGRNPGNAANIDALPEGEQQHISQPEFVLNEQTQAAIRSDFALPKSLFRTRVVAEMLDEMADKPRAGQLFDDLWLTGEMAVCFAERGAGKSILAVQIADSIASGEAIRPFASPPEAQRVLYFDFERSRQQFEARYSRDPDPEDKTVTSPHRFSPNFLWSEIDPCAEIYGDFTRFEDFVLHAIETEVRNTETKVVIIDNIDCFNGEIMRTRDFAYVMKRLRRLKSEHGLSILVLADLRRRSPKQPLAADRLMSTRTLAAFADSVFAIGECRWDSSHRYVKHLASRGAELIYDDSHTLMFHLSKADGNFLSFDFCGFRREELQLDAYMNKLRFDRADTVKELAYKGHTQRQIADRLKMSLASVNRSLHMWSPFDEKVRVAPSGVTSTAETQRRGEEEEPSKGSPPYEGVETAPLLPEEGCPEGGVVGETDGVVLSSSEPEDEEIAKTAEQAPEIQDADHDGIVRDKGHQMFGLRRSVDSNGRDIFIARELGYGERPRVWYRYSEIPGCLTRCVSRGDATHEDFVDSVTERYEPPPPKEEE